MPYLQVGMTHPDDGFRVDSYHIVGWNDSRTHGTRHAFVWGDKEEKAVRWADLKNALKQKDWTIDSVEFHP